MVIAGSINYTGAPVLATEGAMRSGAGLVTLACAGDILILVAPKLVECTFLPLPSDLGSISIRAVDKLQELLKGYDLLLVGSGLGKEKETVGFLKSMLSHTELVSEHRIGFASRATERDSEKEQNALELPPLVLDGDALNILSEWEDWHKSVPENSILNSAPRRDGTPSRQHRGRSAER